MHKRRILAGIAMFFAVLQVCLAQPSQYRFSRIDISNGLSNSQVKCFYKDKRGFMWFGTSSGLNRYDGYSMKVFIRDASDSLSLFNDDVNRIFEGPDGKMWIHTWSGNDIYDPETERFLHNSNQVLEGLSITGGLIIDIKKDYKGNYWFVHSLSGIFKYSPGKGTTALVNIPGDSTSIISNQHTASLLDPLGNLWVIHSNGVLEKIDGITNKVVYRNFEVSRFSSSHEYDFIMDSEGDLWIHAINNNLGVFYLDVSTGKMQRINRTSAGVKLNTDIVRSIVQDNRGLIWIATDHGGINLIDKKKWSVEILMNDPEDGESLVQNSINKLYKDDEGIIWAGSFKKGISFYHENIRRFQLIRHQKSNPNSLPFDDINAFAEDDKGNLWIGTNGGGLIYYDRRNNTFKRYLNDPQDPASISNNVIVCLHIDRDKKLWIGTYFGGLNCFDGKKFTRYKNNPADVTSLSDDGIWEIYEDSQRRLWIGTLSKGVDIFDRDKERFIHYREGAPNSIHASYITSFIEDREGNIWIGTGYGVDFMDKNSGRFIHYLNDINNPASLSNNGILSSLMDSQGRIWFGTHGGLNLYDKKTDTFRSYKKADGLPHNSIVSIVEDDNKNLWVGTPDGISNLVLNPDMNADKVVLNIRNYDEADGLQSKQFTENAGIRTQRGELIFGGPNGFNIVNPRAIQVNTNKPRVILTDFQIFNKPISIGETIDGKVLLDKSISETTEITLKHADNVFSVDFTALSFFHPEKSEYKYKLEGFNQDWLTTDGTQRRVTYTNLDPGVYTFKVIASNNDGVWNREGANLRITILPPFWKTKIAFVLYVLITFAALLLSRKLILERERVKYHMEQERKEAQQTHELDLMKLKFFTNVSHEFRTPLTLIITPLEKILRHTTREDEKKQFQLIYRNARRLLNLVNQLLDFRKMEVQETKLNASEGDIISFIKDTANSFSDLSDKKNIHFSVSSSVQSLETFFDRDKLEKILFNLLSNAFKFTSQNGHVDVYIKSIQKPEDTVSWLEIKVTDDGIGIPREDHDKIFERFFQRHVPDSMVNQGSGIGLSITREFVKAHGGTIRLESEPNKGSCFIVQIPVPEISTQPVTGVTHEETLQDPEIELPANEPIEDLSSKTRKPVLLLVEDNEDFRFYLKDNFKFQYRILEAQNGKEGLKLALQYIPDLIVSDVMMPGMNGMEFCKKVKTDRNISHIPVILLTARTAEEQKMEGFEVGADDYVTKPFNFEILQSRIRNLIHQREIFQKDFRKHIEIKATDIVISSLDEKLIQNAIRMVEENISDADFSVEHLSRELGMSRVNLYKKLLALTGKPPLEFIRTIRLQRAAQLLEKSQLTVAEVAYKVGFNNPKYFARYFKEEYQVLPSAYASSKRT
ncbi:MAG TPA: two-component regulator propeller domain-containing protein [Ohtaekwangia sp.]